MKKKFLSLLVAVCATNALWANGIEINGIHYLLGGDTAEVTYIGDSYYHDPHYSGDIIIPATVTYESQTYHVTSIGYVAFCYCRSLTSITIPNSVTSIGEYAFSACDSLTSVTIGNSVTSIGYRAFSYCHSLTSITIPNSVTSIGEYAFSACSSLTSITIPNSVTSIGEGAFSECDSLTSVTIGNSVTSIGDEAFEDCTSLTSISLPNSVTSIGGGAFSKCSSLTSITIPNSVTSIRYEAFEDCTSLASITLGNSVDTIESEAFSGCISLADIYCYTKNPPLVDDYYAATSGYRVFYNVSKHCYIHVPQGASREYQMAMVWRDFYHIVEISDFPAGQTEVGVTVTNNYATFSWPVNPTASSYTLEIKKSGVLFCTLVFNNLGQLVGMSFAPGRGANNAPAAESTGYGYSFVVTGLSSYTTYNYTFTTKDAQGNVLETRNGSFETTEITAIENINDNDSHNLNHNGNKVIRNGMLLIERNGVYYNAQGTIVE